MTVLAEVQQLQLLLTERCNLTCTHCAVPEEDSPATHELSTVEWGDFIAEVIDSGVRRIVLSGGEAFLRPDCLDIADKALAGGAESLVIVTNGTLFPTTISQRLAALQRQWTNLLVHVSLDGCTPATHDLIRGRGGFDRTMEGVERLRAAGGRIDGVHTVMNRANLAELDEIVNLVNRLRADSWTIFPVAALGRGVDLDALRLDHVQWSTLLERLGSNPPADVELGIMGPIIGDEWTDLSLIPTARSERSPQACVGPDGAVFTCPPLRHVTVGSAARDGGRPWADIDSQLAAILSEACPTCKYRPLCTGVDPSSKSPIGEPIGEPTVRRRPTPIELKVSR